MSGMRKTDLSVAWLKGTELMYVEACKETTLVSAAYSRHSVTFLFFSSVVALGRRGIISDLTLRQQ